LTHFGYHFQKVTKNDVLYTLLGTGSLFVSHFNKRWKNARGAAPSDIPPVDRTACDHGSDSVEMDLNFKLC
jgi:hypothetical protein